MAIDFRGCEVVLKDSRSGDVLCKTQVVEYNRSANQIYLFGIERDTLQRHVAVTIIHPSGVYEYQGNVRKKNTDGLLEISLFQKKETKKEETTKRQSKRFDLSANVQVNQLSGKNPVDEHIVNVQNISVSGILVHSQDNLLKVGDTFIVHLPINNEMIAVKTKVVRLHGKTKNGYEYGCAFESMES